ncbi:MAG: alpha/beta hydrolase [Lachnospiraceae bacterium]|nr:alpha/beta hydrolase [Lachnospiraceae bacterium]
MKKVRKKIWYILGSLICLVLIYKCFISGHSVPILGDAAISEYRTVELGDAEQSILIRGEDKSNPVLLYIHGGPGDPETPYIVPYQKEWEKYFTVVNWDQRGSGRSYHAEIGRDSLNTEQICADAVELTEYLREEFCVDKIYLVGHSYGTYVGMKCIRMKPEYYHAYVGMGQVADQQENEKILISYATEMAEKESNKKAIAELASLGDLPYDQTDFGSKISLSRKWTTYYGGAIFDRKNVNFLFAEAVIRPEYSLMNLMDYLKGEELYYSNTEKDTARWELFHANLHEEAPSVEVPVYFIQGKNDYITSYEACERYFDEMQAPFKELIPLSECAHNPIIEKTDEVSRVLIDKVLLEK